MKPNTIKNLNQCLESPQINEDWTTVYFGKNSGQVGFGKKLLKKYLRIFFKPRVEWKLKHKLPEILEYNQESSRGKVRTTMAYVEKIRAVSKLLAYLIIISRS